MKITAIEAMCLAIPMKPLDPPSAWTPASRKQIVVRVRTDDGLTGVGEAFAYGAPLAVCNVIEESLAPLLRRPGSALGSSTSWTSCTAGTMIYGRRGLAMFAISGVDIALWDLLGKARGAPVYELLGGATRPRLPVYASLMRYDSPADVAGACRQFVTPGLHHAQAPPDRRGVGARGARGGGARRRADARRELPVDARRGHRDGARARAVPTLLVRGARVAARGLQRARAGARADGTPIALGENESTLYGFREIIERARGRHPPAQHHQGRRHHRVQEDRRARPGGQPAHRARTPSTSGPGSRPPSTWRRPGAGRCRWSSRPASTRRPSSPARSRRATAALDVPTGPGLGVEINEEAIPPPSLLRGGRQALRAHVMADYTDRELMVIAAGREIRDGDLVFVGMRLPLLAFAFAKRTHAPGGDRPLRERHRARSAGARDPHDHERHAEHPGRALVHRHARDHVAAPAGAGGPGLHRRRRDRQARQPQHQLYRRLAQAEGAPARQRRRRRHREPGQALRGHHAAGEAPLPRARGLRHLARLRRRRRLARSAWGLRAAGRPRSSPRSASTASTRRRARWSWPPIIPGRASSRCGPRPAGTSASAPDVRETPTPTAAELEIVRACDPAGFWTR